LRSDLPLAPGHTARCVRIFGYLGAPTLLHHLVACSLLLPERLPGDDAASSALTYFAELVQARCRLLFVSLPRDLAGEDVESPQQRDAAIALARAIVRANRGAEDGAQALQSPYLRGDVEVERVAMLLDVLETAPLGCAHAWMLAAELMGTALCCGTAYSDAPASYRRALLSRLASLSEQSPEIFLRALVAGDEVRLREPLRALCDAMRGVAALGTAAR
jgi:hypothetical protein